MTDHIFDIAFLKKLFKKKGWANKKEAMKSATTRLRHTLRRLVLESNLAPVWRFGSIRQRGLLMKECCFLNQHSILKNRREEQLKY
jgi:hypothetical protein